MKLKGIAMKTFVWWDSEGGEEEFILKPFTAENFEDALDKAIWLFMGELGEQLEYELPITIRDVQSGECRKWDIRVTYDQPTINKTEIKLSAGEAHAVRVMGAMIEGLPDHTAHVIECSATAAILDSYNRRTGEDINIPDTENTVTYYQGEGCEFMYLYTGSDADELTSKMELESQVTPHNEKVTQEILDEIDQEENNNV